MRKKFSPSFISGLFVLSGQCESRSWVLYVGVRFLLCVLPFVQYSITLQKLATMAPHIFSSQLPATSEIKIVRKKVCKVSRS